MNKTQNINLGGVPFIIDEDAFLRLDHYLKALEKHFAKSESKEEILGDIEARIAEIFQNGLGNKKIVEERDVIHAIGIMGTPDDFKNEAYEAAYDDEPKSSAWDIKTGKKLFRDPDDKVIGGVCSGLAAYFGIQEALWVRIGFAFVFFTMGFGLLLYIIMWALVPEAKTASDRLAMRGEPINIDSIAQNVESGFETISGKIQEFSKDFKRKKKSRNTKTHSHDFKASGGVGETGNFGQTGPERISVLEDDEPVSRRQAPGNGITRGIKTIALVIGAVLLLALFGIWIGLLGGAVAFGHVTSFIVPWTGALSYIAAIPMILIVAVPLFGIARGIIRTFRPSPVKKRRSWVGIALFILGVIGFSAIVNFTLSSMDESATVDNEMLSFSVGTATLGIDMYTDRPSQPAIHTDLVDMGKDYVSIRNVDLSISKSPDDQFHVFRHVTARGSDAHMSRIAAGNIEYNLEMANDTLRLEDAFTIFKPNKYRAQSVHMEIQIPEGASVAFNEKALFKIDCAVFPEHELHKELIGHTFIMGSERLEYDDRSEEEKALIGFLD